ncbi:MAG: ABC transporter ATP-binding protein, partial [Clostridiales bacterium]|nr:ABC transporter ATP-binding protein [Clostridiales bacterium]
LILDEPTNHLDIPSREWMEAAVEEFEGALLFVSHDRYFVDRFATRIWELEGQKIHDYPFGYQKYRAVKAHEVAPRPAPAPARPKKERPKNTRDLEKTVTKLEREIEKQEALVAAFEPKIAAAATDYQELTRLLEEKAAAEAQLEAWYAQWEQASAELGG